MDRPWLRNAARAAAEQVRDVKGYGKITGALLALKDKLLCAVTLVLQCQLVEGLCGELYDEEGAMIQKLSSEGTSALYK